MFVCTCTVWTCTADPCMQSLQGILPKHADRLPKMPKSRLKNQPPSPPITQSSPFWMTAAWRFARKCKGSHFVSVWKGVSTKTNDSLHPVKGLFFFFFLLNLHGSSCCRLNPLIAVWAQINDTSEAPLDATEVQ